ncbi:MAG: DUF6789 family protein, partial [Gemmatimonadales bacterium]
MTRNWGKAVTAGLVGTAVMTLVGIWIAPLMGMPRMNPADMLAGAMGGNVLLGWVAHFMIGAILAVIYAAVAPALPGAPAVRGALYSLAPWLVAGVIMMPMMGMPVFGGSGRRDGEPDRPPRLRRRGRRDLWPAGARGRDDRTGALS